MSRPAILRVMVAAALVLTACGKDGLAPENNEGYDGSVQDDGGDADGSVIIATWTGKPSQVTVLCTQVDGVVTMTVSAPDKSTASTAQPETGAGTASVTIGYDGELTTIAATDEAAVLWARDSSITSTGTPMLSDGLSFHLGTGVVLSCAQPD